MPQLTHREQTEFLNTRGILMRIACVRSDGSPLVTPIWFIYQEAAVYFTPRARSEWFDCLRGDSRVALCIDEEAHPYRKVVMEGHADLCHDVGEDEQWRDLYRAIARRYIPDDAAEQYIQNTLDQPRGLYRLTTSGAKVRSWRMPLQHEAPEGIWHDRYYGDGTLYKRPDKKPG